MFKANTEETARELAREHNLSHGFSVFDGKWYVGTTEQLAAIGCILSKQEG